MQKLLQLILFIIISQNICAQSKLHQSNSLRPEFTYYIRMTGISSRIDVEYVQGVVNRKTAVNFFMANRYPVRYFLLKSNRVIPASEFQHWLNGRYRIEFYGEENKGREQAILLYNKIKART